MKENKIEYLFKSTKPIFFYLVLLWSVLHYFENQNIRLCLVLKNLGKNTRGENR